MFYVIIKYFFLPDCNSQHFYRLNTIPHFTVTTLKTLLQMAMHLVERWNRHSKIILKLVCVIS